MKLDSVLTTTHLNTVQIIYLIELKTVVTLSGTLDFCQRYCKPKATEE